MRFQASSTDTRAYAIKSRSPHGFDETVERLTAALQKEGFGVLTTIDIQAKMKEKLDRDMPRYLVLGACNPALAWEAVHAEPDVGVLLPCNVCVMEADEGIVVSGMEPKAAMSLIDNETVAQVADEASQRLHRAIESAVGA